MLRPGRPVANRLARGLVPEHLDGMGIIARHERRSRRATVGPLAVGAGKERSARGETVDIRSLANLAAVAGERRSGQIIRDDEQNIIWFPLPVTADEETSRPSKKMRPSPKVIDLSRWFMADPC